MAKKSKRAKLPDDPVLRELDAIKRLLIVALIKAGTPQKEVATALQIDPGDLSRMMPSKKFKPFGETNNKKRLAKELNSGKE
jgi:hypothetical protein